MTVLSVSGISLSFGINKVIDNVSFSVNETDRLGIIGVNGCGKTTLFKLLTGEYTPDEGQIFLANGKTVGILKQDGAFHLETDGGGTALAQMISAFPELLAAERELNDLQKQLHERAGETDSRELSLLANRFSEKNAAFIAAGGLEFRARASSTLLKMGIDATAAELPVSALSGGQRTRVALARQLAREPDVLLLDEPTNHLDLETVTFLENFLISYRKCVLVVSHDRYFLDRVTNKTMVLEYGRATLYNGGYTASAEQRRIDKEIAEHHYRTQQKEIARQEAYIEQQRAWNRERNIIAAESRLKLLAKMEKLERPKEAPKPIRLSFESGIASGNEVLTVRRLSMGFGEKKLFSDLNFLLTRGERLFVTGPNGCGKSTLLKLILGKLAATGGRVEAGYNVEIGYYDQENQNLTPENTVLDELWNAYPNRNETEIRNTLALFRFIGEDVFRTVSVLSGGERARLTLAKLILSQMNLLVLDEPTNHLDIDSREALETALLSFDGTLLCVSHDRSFINHLATRILALSTRTPEGYLDFRAENGKDGYDQLQRYLEKHSLAEEKTETPQSENKTAYLKRRQDAADERREKTKIERMKKEAAALEAELAEIEEQLFGEAATDYKKAAELDARKTEAEERLLEIYEVIGI